MLIRHSTLIWLILILFTTNISVASNRCDGDTRPPNPGECTGR